MKAVVVHATISDFDQAHQALNDETIPKIAAAPGFVTGWWLAPREDGKGMAVVVFDSEEAAAGLLAVMQPGAKPNPYATVESVELRDIAGHA
jgi:hypothetical protein